MSSNPTSFLTLRTITFLLFCIGIPIWQDASAAAVSDRPAASEMDLTQRLLLKNDTIPARPETGEKIFQIQHIERLPEFKGGMQGWARYLQFSLKYPRLAKERGVTGKVILQFVVEQDGTLTNVQVLKSPDELLSEEALRVVKKSPRWLPGVQDGRSVRVAYTMPISFALGTGPATPIFPTNP